MRKLLIFFIILILFSLTNSALGSLIRVCLSNSLNPNIPLLPEQYLHYVASTRLDQGNFVVYPSNFAHWSSVPLSPHLHRDYYVDWNRIGFKSPDAFQT